MTIEQLEQLRADITTEITSRGTEKPKIVRICEDYPIASGGRRGFLRTVTAVDPTGTNGYAFDGDFLPDGKEIDLPVGAIVIQKEPTGSVKNGSWDWTIYKITETGLEHIETYDKKNFLTFRDRVAELITK